MTSAESTVPGVSPVPELSPAPEVPPVTEVSPLTDVPAALPPRRGAIGMLAAVAVFALVADLISKLLVVRNIDPARPVSVLDGLIHVTNTRNPGAAFSFAAGSGATIVFGFVAVAVIVLIVRSARRIRSLWWSLGLGLLLGGASGNLVDRIFRSPGVMRGHVVDWIQFPHFAIFNLADSAIVGGGILLAVLATRGLEMDGSRTTKHKP